MLGLEFSLAHLVNAVVGGAIGGAVAFWISWRSTRKIRSDVRESIDHLVTVARGLEEGFRTGKLTFEYEDRKIVGIRFGPIKVHDSSHGHTSEEVEVSEPLDESGQDG